MHYSIKIKRTYLLTSASIIFAWLLIAYSTRSSYITDYDWKQTNDAIVCGDIICFNASSSYSYSWPLIKKNGKPAAIVLFQCNGRMCIFSTKEKTFALFMAI